MANYQGIRFAALYTFLVVACLALSTSAAAQSQLKVLHTFQGDTNGANPTSTLIFDNEGNLYGVTADAIPGTGFGSIFKLDREANLTTLYRFMNGSDGSSPNGPLVRDRAGNIYGTTSAGGDFGSGTVFKLDINGNLTDLYEFLGSGDGASPNSGLTSDGAGNLYGTTSAGGSGCGGVGCGTVFKVKIDGSGKATLHKFSGTNDGSVPQGPLVLDSSGNLYGTTSAGGASQRGTVFKVSLSRDFDTIYAFRPTPDGRAPLAGVLLASDGTLYGTTSSGGSSGEGTVYKIDPLGVESVLFNFGAFPLQGISPASALIQDASGNLYGTTEKGGKFFGVCTQPDGCGVIFELDPRNILMRLYGFAGRQDGKDPNGGLVMDSQGNLYGTAFQAGSFDGICSGAGCGVIYEYTASLQR